MKGCKAFDNGLVCKGKQYAENTGFEKSGGKIEADTWYRLKNGKIMKEA